MLKPLGTSLLLATAIGAAACTVHETEAPPLTGPSEFALAISVAASPDVITLDGVDRSTVIVTARDINGQPVANVAFRLLMEIGGVVQDYGTLSQRTIVTGADGRATAVYTSPAPPPPPAGASAVVVTINAMPSGSNFQNARGQSADILLMPRGVILPPGPTPRFTATPDNPVPAQQVLFDASASCAFTSACDSAAGIVSFAWLFGDGSSGSGLTTTHAYGRPGSYPVTLTVTTDRGSSASTTQIVTVGQSAAPSGQIVMSPTGTINTSTLIYFTVTNVTPGTGRTIVSYSWNFGDPGAPDNTASGQSATHQYLIANTYTVVLTITDDIGQVAQTSISIKVDP